MSTQSTCAKRLYNVLSQAARLRAQTKTKHNRSERLPTNFNVWVEVAGSFEIAGSVEVANANSDGVSQVAVTTIVQKVVELIEDTSDAVSRSTMNEDAKKQYASQINALRRCVDIRRIGQSWDLDVSKEVAFLIALDDHLQRVGQTEPTLDADSLSDLVDQLDSAFRFVEKSEITPELRRFLLASLNALLFCIRHASIYGPSGIRAAYLKTLGDLNDALPEEPSQQEKEAFGRVVAAIKRLDSGVVVYERLLTYANYAQKLLSYAGVAPSPD